MEEILNKIIEIDNKAKAIVNEEKDKKENIEDIIEQEFKTQKAVIDLEYKDEINKKKAEKTAQLEEKKIKIDNNLQTEIDKIQKSYYENESEIIANILSSIKNEEN